MQMFTEPYGPPILYGPMKQNSNLRRKSTLRQPLSTRCFFYEEESYEGPIQIQRPSLRPLKTLLTATDRENQQPNCRCSIGIAKSPFYKKLPEKARLSVTTRFKQGNFASPQHLSRKLSKQQFKQKSPLDFSKKMDDINAFESNRRQTMGIRPNNPSFLISPMLSKQTEDFRMQEYFVKKSQIGRKYMEMISRLKIEEGDAISHEISKIRQGKELAENLQEKLDEIKSDYVRTINLIEQQRIVEEQELLKKYKGINSRC